MQVVERPRDLFWLYERVGPLHRDRNKQRDAFEKVAELNPRRASAHVWLGHYHMRHGFYRKALAAFRAAVKADSTDYRAALGLAAALEFAELMVEGSPKNSTVGVCVRIT